MYNYNYYCIIIIIMILCWLIHDRAEMLAAEVDELRGQLADYNTVNNYGHNRNNNYN